VEYLLQFYAIYGSVINFIGINALLALSLNVTLSAGMLSLGNAAFAAIGGYTAGILSLHFNRRAACAAPPGGFSCHGDARFR
jgi:ABC-type branched-subunit amino acid transport system permease subunit